mmetsp:Transcript_54167/g.156512  ORF Transcript_54167/g.156512 Transcript_54167/m.156512 type:complete len:810 (+) Transcript_54167:77-2506(+)
MGCSSGKTAKVTPSTTAGPIEDLQGVHEIVEGATAGVQVPGETAERSARPVHYLVVFLSCSVPSAATVLGLSLMGFGIQVYSEMAPHEIERLSHVFSMLSIVYPVLLFLLDAHQLPGVPRSVAAALLFALVEATALLKGSMHPWAPVGCSLMPTPLALMEIRRVWCHDIKRTSFYKMVCACASLTTLCLLLAWAPWTFLTNYSSTGALWTAETKTQLIRDSAKLYEHIYRERTLDWATDCGPSKEVPEDMDVAAEIMAACTKAQTVWIVILTVPFIAVLLQLLVAAFGFLRCRLDLDKEEGVVSFLHEFMVLLVGVLMGVYATLYAAGASTQLASAFMAFFAMAMLALMVYTLKELRPNMLQKASERSALLKYFAKGLQSDWVKALAIGTINLLIPAFLGLDVLRQQVRRCRGKSVDDELQTQVGKRIMSELRAWNWSGILLKVVVIGELFACVVLGGKFAFVVFSWLNKLLADVELMTLGIILACVGCVMFLLPPVPGSAVYIFFGIVIGKNAQGNIGFWPGVGVGSLVGLAVKLLASTGQYYIGHFLGKSVRVQKAVGGDTVPTRAVEKILKHPGMKVGKVAILVGGPDWPTSVICGILQVSVPQMLLGTLPVYFVSIAPQTLVGALLTKELGSNDAKMWVALKTVATGIAALSQAAACGVAAYAVMKTVERDHVELAQYRADHQDIAELTRREAAFVDALFEETRWSALSRQRRLVLSAAALAHWAVAGLLLLDYTLLRPICFRKFDMTADIAAPFVDGGLDGNVLNIALLPFGAGSLALFFVGVLLHACHICDLRRAAKRRLEES